MLERNSVLSLILQAHLTGCLVNRLFSIRFAEIITDCVRLTHVRNHWTSKKMEFDVDLLNITDLILFNLIVLITLLSRAMVGVTDSAVQSILDVSTLTHSSVPGEQMSGITTV